MSQTNALDLLRSELKKMRKALNSRIDRLEQAAEEMAAETGLSQDVAALQAELEQARKEQWVRIALIHAQYAIGRDGAIEGAATMAEQAEALASSALFDAAWYLEAHADLKEAGIDPADHYLRIGAFEGRDPGPEFSSMAYYIANQDVAQAGWPALVHYEMFGRVEGRPLHETA